MQAKNDFIIVKNMMNEEQKTESGLIKSRANTSAENNGIVVSVGDGVMTSGIVEGALVWFSSVECRIGDEERKLVAVREKSIIAVGE